MRTLVIAVLCAFLIACDPPVTPPTASPSPSATPVSVPSHGCGSDLPLPTPAATPACATPPTSSATTTPAVLDCILPMAREATTSDPAFLTDVEVVGQQDGYDRVAFVFGDGKGVPALQIKQVQPPFTTDPAGLPLDVSGSAFVELRFEGAGRDPTRDVPTNLVPDLTELVHLRMEGDFEGVLTYIAGLAEPPCLHATAADSPNRYVIDFAAAP